jgi:hypothetical protein
MFVGKTVGFPHLCNSCIFPHTKVTKPSHMLSPGTTWLTSPMFTTNKVLPVPRSQRLSHRDQGHWVQRSACAKSPISESHLGWAKGDHAGTFPTLPMDWLVIDVREKKPLKTETLNPPNQAETGKLWQLEANHRDYWWLRFVNCQVVLDSPAKGKKNSNYM